MALTELGYERPTYDELLERQIERAKLLFGNDIDTSNNSILGKYIRLNVDDLAEVHEIAELVYFSAYPNTATGVSLDRICPLVNIARNPATYAKHNVRFVGTAGEYVPEAFEVSTADGTLLFHLYDSLLIGEDGTVDGVVECETAGAVGNVGLGKIDTIVNPDANVESIVHLGIAAYGEEAETDTALRARFGMTISGAGSGTDTAIKGAILRVPLVDGAVVIENDSDETVDGIPPHSFKCYVLCPESQDALVAEAILNKKPMGIKPVGDVSVDVVDGNGITRKIAFSRTAQKNIYIKMSISINPYFNADGVEQIKAAICEHINNLKNDDDVFLSSIYGCVYRADGVVNVSSLTMSTNGSTYNTSDITVGIGEVARISTDNIEVVVA